MNSTKLIRAGQWMKIINNFTRPSSTTPRAITLRLLRRKSLFEISVRQYPASSSFPSPFDQYGVTGWHQIHVRGLPPATTQSDLERHFSQFGTIRQCKLKTVINGAYISFKTKQEADNALSASRHVISGRAVQVYDKGQQYCLAIKSLAPSTTAKTLSEFYSQFGAIKNCALRWDEERNASRQIAYIDFQTAEGLHSALKSHESKPHEFDGKQVAVLVPRPKDSTLFVGLLSANTTEESLRKYFAGFGTVTHCRMKRDPNDGSRLIRCGYVTFASSQKAAQVLSRQSHEIDGKQVYVGCDQAGSLIHQSNDTTIRVVNLAAHTTEDSLEAHFNKFGQLMFATIVRDPATWQSRGFGQLTYVDKEGVQKAIAGCPHRVDETDIMIANHSTCLRLFVAGLSPSTTLDSFSRFFSQFGPLLSCDIEPNSKADQDRFYGYVNYFDEESANRARNARPHVIDGNRVATFPGDRRLARQLTLFIKNLNMTTSDDMLHAYFSQYGKPVYWEVKRDRNNRSRGFGFVAFSTKEEVNKALAIAQHTIDDRDVQIGRVTREERERRINSTM